MRTSQKEIIRHESPGKYRAWLELAAYYFCGFLCGWIALTYFRNGRLADLSTRKSQQFMPSLQSNKSGLEFHHDIIPYREFASTGHSDETVIATSVASQIRICCWIVTMPESHATKAVAVKATWANRCTKYLFISSVDNDTLPSIAAVDHEDRNVLWNKTAYAMLHSAGHFLDVCDYFLKADDDTYVIVENLRYLLMEHDSATPFIMGRHFKPFVKQGYLSGGAGYVISKSGLQRMVEGILKNLPECVINARGGAEDVNVGACAYTMGVTLLDSRDARGLERFHPFPPTSMIDQGGLESLDWFLKYNFHKIVGGVECCSDYAVSFHYVDPESMYMLHYALYHLHPFGIHRDFSDALFLARFQGIGWEYLRRRPTQVPSSAPFQNHTMPNASRTNKTAS